MTPWMIALGAGILLAMAPSRRPPRSSDHPAPAVRAAERAAMRVLVQKEADRQGVPRDLALATVAIESDFDPRAEGDLRWHERTDRYDRVVPTSHPLRGQPWLWHSYGLFQLLAPYHVLGDEDPRELLDARLNAQRGIATLKRLLSQHNADYDRVRLAYTGALRAAPAVQTAILQRWRRQLEIERGGIA